MNKAVKANAINWCGVQLRSDMITDLVHLFLHHTSTTKLERKQ